MKRAATPPEESMPVDEETLDALEAAADFLESGGWSRVAGRPSLAAGDPERRVNCPRERGFIPLRQCAGFRRDGDAVCWDGRPGKSEGTCELGSDRSWELACIEGEIFRFKMPDLGDDPENEGEGEGLDSGDTKSVTANDDADSMAKAIASEREGERECVPPAIMELPFCACGCGQRVKEKSRQYRSLECWYASKKALSRKGKACHCGAIGDEPCRTVRGTRAKGRHWGRPS